MTGVSAVALLTAFAAGIDWLLDTFPVFQTIG
jgi:hypothetical protein